jgi:outer membrane protein assembly factor BamB
MRNSLLAGAATLVLSVASPAWATPTKSFHQASSKDFEEGEATASLILPDGEIVPGFKADKAGMEATAFVWCSALSRDGRVAYFGTGDEGKLFAVDVDAKGEEKARRVATLDAAWITALAVRPDGTLLAGTTPGGRVFSVDPRTGAVKPFTKVGADHVWALSYDDKTGTTFVGTGTPGKIFAVDAGGKARQLWDSGDKHVVSLARADDGHLLAGTSEEAILFRVSTTSGTAEALQDFEAEEVRAIARAGDVVYVAVNDFDKTTPVVPVGPPLAKGTRIVLSAAGTPSSAGALPRPGQRKSKAALYRLERDGRIEQVFSIGDGYFTALTVDEDGGAYVASGTQGRVYRVRPDRTAALAIDLPERQALTLVRAGGAFLVGTGDVGGIYRARAATSDQATYLSRVLDAEGRARWGLFRWHGAKDVTIETRAGSTAKPDGTWSAFQALQSAHQTGQGGTGQVASPASRYVQYRATLAGASARLGDVTLAYLPFNQRARLTEFTATDGTAAGGAAPTPGTAPNRGHSPVLKLRWKVENPDGDELTYRLSYREENEAVWRPLPSAGADPLLKPEYDWNTEGLPDGTYVARVVTSDERAQPRERALDSTFLSTPILVDNRKPEVVGLAVKLPFVSGRARDEASPLTQLELSVDGGEWRELAPADGICDDLVEAFTVKLPALAPGPHAVTVRAWDSADNVGAAALTVRVP